MKFIKLSSIKETLKKHWEFVLALFFFILIAVSIWVEFTFFKLNLYSFLVVVNLNLLLLFITFFIVMRKLFRLFLERRRKIFGSQLRSRLVIAFVITSLIPAIFIFVIFTRIVSTSVDYWFSSQVEKTLEKSSILGNMFFKTVSNELQKKVDFLLKNTVAENNVLLLENLENLILYLNNDETYITLIDDKFVPMLPIDSKEQALITKVFQGSNPTLLDSTTKISFLEEINNTDYVVLLYKIEYQDTRAIKKKTESFNTGYIFLSKVVGSGFTSAQKDIAKEVLDYQQIHANRDPIKFSFFYLLGLLTLMIIFGSVWYGLRISRELTAPIVALAEAFKKISAGNLDVTLQDTVMTEEMKMLFTSFNAMAMQLSISHTRIMLANQNLEYNNREIEAQKVHIETIMENITTGVVSLDVHGNIKSINKPVLELFSLAPEELLEKKLLSLLPAQFLPLFQEMSENLQTTNNKWQKQITLQINGIEKKLLIVALSLPLSYFYGGTVIVFDDITDLDKSYRIEAWKEVARRIAHEIKNPLTPIKLSAQRLMKRYATLEDEVFIQCTKQIIYQVEHLQQLVGEFSHFARLPEIVRATGDIRELLTKQILFFKTTYPQITFTYTNTEPLPMISFDVSAMQRVFMNLFTNAIDALENVENPSIETTISYNTTLHSIYITITDNGVGILPNTLSRLFEPYFSNKKEGTGLGLAIVQSIIADHRGYIRAKSAVGKGTSMIIELPVEV